MNQITPLNLAVAAGLWLLFVAALFVGRKLVPGPVRQGQPLRDGTRKSYKLNGLRLLVLLAAFLAVGEGTHLFSLAALNRLFWPLFVVANIGSVAHTGYLFVTGRRSRGQENVLRDLWFGPELNPELLGV